MKMAKLAQDAREAGRSSPKFSIEQTQALASFLQLQQDLKKARRIHLDRRGNRKVSFKPELAKLAHDMREKGSADSFLETFEWPISEETDADVNSYQSGAAGLHRFREAAAITSKQKKASLGTSIANGAKGAAKSIANGAKSAATSIANGAKSAAKMGMSMMSALMSACEIKVHSCVMCEYVLLEVERLIRAKPNLRSGDGYYPGTMDFGGGMQSGAYRVYPGNYLEQNEDISPLQNKDDNSNVIKLN